MTQQKMVVLLPLKAHSERIPGKNFKMFAGKPLFKWILDTLHMLEDVSTIVINTDARDILQEHGIEDYPKVLLRDRPKKLCDDMTSMNLIIKDDIENTSADMYLMTHCTNPLLSADTIQAAVDRFRKKNAESQADSLFTTNKFQTRFYEKDGTPINHDPNNLIRTQDLPPWHEENSCLYIFTGKSFESTGSRIGLNPILFEIPKWEAIDIDEPEDWEVGEAIAAYKNKC